MRINGKEDYRGNEWAVGLSDLIGRLVHGLKSTAWAADLKLPESRKLTVARVRADCQSISR